jgi:hypothetical protein
MADHRIRNHSLAHSAHLSGKTLMLNGATSTWSKKIMFSKALIGMTKIHWYGICVNNGGRT